MLHPPLTPAPNAGEGCHLAPRHPDPGGAGGEPQPPPVTHPPRQRLVQFVTSRPECTLCSKWPQARTAKPDFIYPPRSGPAASCPRLCGAGSPVGLGDLWTLPAPPPHLPTHLQLGGAGIFPLFPRVEIIWENICVLWSSKSRPWCLEGDGDLGTDPAPAKPLAGGTPACLHEVFLQRGPAFGSQPGNLWIGNAWGKGQPWPRWGTGQDQACDGAGAAPGVPPRPGDASAPLPVKIYGRSRESEQREGGRSRRRDHPGLDPAACHRPGSTMTPSIPPVASPVGTFGGGFHAESSLPAALHPLAQASPRQAGGLAFLPPLPSTPPQRPPMSPWPHRPSLPPAQLHPRPVTRTACPPVLCCLLCNTRLHLP